MGNPSKSQGGFYAYNSGQGMMTSSSSALKSGQGMMTSSSSGLKSGQVTMSPSSALKPGQGNYFVSSTGTKYQSYTQNLPSQYPQQPHSNYNPNITHSPSLHTPAYTQQSPIQQPTYQPSQPYSNYVNGVYK